MTESERAVVLLVENDPDIAEQYSDWLRPDYEVRVARSGSAAVERLDEEIDVVVAGLEISEVSDGAIPAEIDDQGIDCRVAMVVGADSGPINIPTGFDEYLIEPLTRDELRATVEQLAERVTLNNELEEYASLVTRKAELEAEESVEEQRDDDEERDLEDQITSARRSVDDSLGDLSSDEEFIGSVRELDRPTAGTEAENDEEDTEE